MEGHQSAPTREVLGCLGRNSVAALISLLALVSSAVGATGSVSHDGSVSTPSIFAPVSTPAFAIRDLSYFVLGICAVIFVVVGGLLAYSLVRFRRRRGDETANLRRSMAATRSN